MSIHVNVGKYRLVADMNWIITYWCISRKRIVHSYQIPNSRINALYNTIPHLGQDSISGGAIGPFLSKLPLSWYGIGMEYGFTRQSGEGSPGKALAEWLECQSMALKSYVLIPALT